MVMPANSPERTSPDALFLTAIPTLASFAPTKSAEGQRASGFRAINQSGLLACFQDGEVLAPKNTRARNLNLVAKKLFDVSFALAALLALAPLLLLVAIAIKLSDGGPVFFRQERVGKGGKLFRIFKFRSMYVDRCDDTGVAQTTATDDRVMPVGNFIRRTSIDELPQLLNVLRGEMSMVGPRPHVSGQLAGGQPYADVVPYYDARHMMLPGLTGWAQANGFRGSTADIKAAQGRVDHDIAYIQNFSFALDVKIIVKTIAREFITGSGY
jgi:polysaccharide biosynthesis protein PslA